MPLSPGTQLGPYEIIECIGAGGMGEVYRARDRGLDRDVAIKVLPSAANNADQVRRLEQEAKALGALNHPHILAVYATGTHDGITYVVSELLAGDTLHSRLRSGPLSTRKALDISAQMARGLAAAHARGVIHGDVKPANVFLTSDGHVKILDFGLARLLARTGEDDPTAAVHLDVPAAASAVGAGTPGYMSPEQVRGQSTDHRSDVFSFGAVLYEMLAGRRAFQRDTAGETLLSTLQDDPVLPTRDRAPALARIVSRCLEKRPEDRFHSTDDLAFALEAISDPAEGARANDASRRRNWTAIAAVAASLAVLLSLGALAARRQREPAGPTPVPNIRTLAVLPFKPLVPGSGDAALELGMTDALITKLSNIRQIAVRPTTSILGFGSAGQDLKQAGAALEADVLLDGRVQQDGDRIRLTVQLIRVADGTTMWADHFDERFESILGVQDSIGDRVARALALKLTTQEQQGLSKRYTGDLQAYQLYVKGRYHWSTFNPAELLTSINYFNEALARDPSYALAYTGLANAYEVIAIYGPLPARDALPKASDAAYRAVRLDPGLAQAQVAVGAVKLFAEQDWVGAERALSRARDLDPNLLDAHELYAYYLQAMGRTGDAVDELRRARDLAPEWVVAANDVPTGLFLARRYDEAIDTCRAMLRLEPNQTVAALLGQSLFQKGQREEGVAALRQSLDTPRSPSRMLRTRAELGYALAVMGQTAAAARIVKEIAAQPGPWTALSSAEVYAGMGDRDRAFAALDRSIDERFPFTWHVKVLPQFDTLRADPRYPRLLQRLKLTP